LIYCLLMERLERQNSFWKDKAYVDVTDNLTFLNDNSFIWTSEKDGFNHIYLYDKNGKLRNQVTGKEVTSYYGFDEKQILFFISLRRTDQSTELYRIALNGKSKLALSDEIGTNDATLV
jgi:dipeptidyl-peptidase-4